MVVVSRSLTLNKKLKCAGSKMTLQEKFFRIAKAERQKCRYMCTWPKLTARCAACSHKLFKRLKELGYKPQIIVNYWHCFVLCQGYLLDITASQFDTYDVDVTVIKYAERKHHYFWKMDRVAKNSLELEKILKKDRWPKDQWPRFSWKRAVFR